MNKRVFSVFLAAFLSVALLPVSAHAYTLSELTVKGLDYTQVGNFSEGYAVVSKDVNNDGYQEYGLIDSQGNLVVPLKYDYMGTVSEGFAKIGVNTDGDRNTRVSKSVSNGVDKFGFIGVTGKEIVPPIYDSVTDFSDGMAAVSNIYIENRGALTLEVSVTGFVDNTGKEVIPLIYINVGSTEVVSATSSGASISFKTGFSEGLVAVHEKDGDGDGVIDKQGNTVIPFSRTYARIGGFNNGMAYVYVNGKYGYIDKQGAMVIPAIYDEGHDFSEGYAVVGKKNSDGKMLYGAINQAGNIVVPIIYYGMTPFHDGMARVYEKDEAAGPYTVKYGFVNTEGKLAVPMVYREVSDYSDGLAVVSIKDERFEGSQYLYGCIDKQGKVVIPLEYCTSFKFADGIAYVCKGYPSNPFFPSNTPNYLEQFCGKMRELGTTPECSCIDTSGKTVISFGDREKNYSSNVIFSGETATYKKSNGQYAIIKNPQYKAQSNAAFTDVPAWCAKEAQWAVDQKITNGYGNKTTFAPNVDCTQAQILTFLWRAEGERQAATAPITTSASYQGAINWAYEMKMIDNSFNPDDPCTRSQAVQYIWKALGELKAKEEASFSDMAANAPYADAVSWAVEKGVTKGYGGADTFAPDRVCTRGEIVCFLYRAYNN